MASVAIQSTISGERDAEHMPSEHECDLMIDALRRELDGVRDHLAWLTYHLNEEDGELLEEEEEEEEEDHGTAPQITGRVGERTGTPRPAAKKGEKAREELERAAKAAAIKRERHRYLLSVVDAKETKEKDLREERLHLMRVCIERQREQLQEMSEKLRRRMERSQRKERALKLQKKPVHFRSTGTSDTSYQSNIYHSLYYQVVHIEQQLKRSGKLKGPADTKQFWDSMLSVYPPPPSSPLDNASSTHKASNREEEKETEEEYENSWALTTLPADCYKKSPSNNSPTGHVDRSSSSQHPPLRLPQLHGITAILNQGSSAQHHTSKLNLRAHQERMMELEKGKMRLRHMYQQACSNQMVMRRLLPDIKSLSFEGALSAMSAYHSNPAPLPPTTGGRQPTEKNTKLRSHTLPSKSPSVSHPLSRSHKPYHRSEMDREKHVPPMPTAPLLTTQISPSTTPPLTTHTSHSTTPLLTTNSCQEQSPAKLRENLAEKQLLPLTMDNLFQSRDVKESKGKRGMWSNYT